MITVKCEVCQIAFDIYPSRYNLCQYKKFFCTRICKDSAQVKTPEERKETKQACNRRCRDYRYAQRRAWIDEIKMQHGCNSCGYKKHPAALHFHHRYPSEKKFGLAQGWMHGRQKVLEEMAKCDVLCANCHAEQTVVDRKNGLISFNLQLQHR